jgi:hypothetical protein
MTEKEEPANLNLIVEYNCEIYSRMKGRIEVIDP